MAIRRPKSTKNPPILSHEFVIQNHADIVSCIAMVLIVGLMFQISNSFCSMFVALQHNITVNATDDADEVTLYTYGLKDILTAFFYFLIAIVIHAVIKEYALDKINRKLHLSKVKNSKFNESGQLAVFYAVSAVFGADIVYNEHYLTNINSLWEGYPHATLPFFTKFYFIVQIAYWIHCFPELYFEKIKKEEMPARIQYAALYLIFITSAYLLNFTRVALCLLVLHYIVEFVFHFSRILYFSDRKEAAATGFILWNVLFVLVRLGSITLAVLTFWYGLEKSKVASIDFAEGNFNIQIVRINCLLGVCFLQGYMMWNFITFQQRRARERAEAEPSRASVAAAAKMQQGSPAAKKRASKKVKEDGETAQNGSAQQGSSPKAAKKRQ